MKILSTPQVKEWDAYTIQEEFIASIQLMERAVVAFTKWFMQHFPNTEKASIKIFCGTGNNGGNGLAIARLLHHQFYNIELFCCQISSQKSLDYNSDAILPGGSTGAMIL